MICIKVAFSNKGGQPKSVELKNFKAPDSNNVKLASTVLIRLIIPLFRLLIQQPQSAAFILQADR